MKIKITLFNKKFNIKIKIIIKMNKLKKKNK